MSVLKKIGWFLVGLALVLFIIATVFVMRMKPDYAGTKALTSLDNEVTVYYDTYGIPHIYGENEKDAIRALGYVHAQDRLWQMEVIRRIGSGRLAEVFGKDLVITDKFFLALGVDDASIKTVEKLDKNSEAVQLSEAYLDGINQFIKKGPTPIEFYLTGIEKSDFSLKDIYNVMGYMAFSFAQAHKTDPLLSNIKTKLGSEYLTDLAVGANPNTTWINNYKSTPPDSIGNSVSAMVTKALGVLNIPLFEGSNSWVIAPEKTKNGKVILANDPHIGFSQPSVWFEAHVETPNYANYGYFISGLPFPILGHDREVAYGITMFENDDVDFYFEETNPNNEKEYKTTTGWKNYENITKTIKVKDAKDVVFTYKKTQHGPVLNNIAEQIRGERPIAMSWSYTQIENKTIDALHGFSHASNLEEFKQAVSKIHAPGLNMMYGDAKGNVAWFAAAQLYEVPDSVNTKMVFENGQGLPVQKKLLDFSENPQAINPPWNFVYTANNQPDSVGGKLYAGYYLPENRAKRIVALLEPKNDWDKKSTSEMITDNTSAVNPTVAKHLVNLLDFSLLNTDEQKVIENLELWSGEYALESVDATVYTRWIYYLLENTFKDELGDVLFEQFLTTHFQKRLIATLSSTENSIWWDNVLTTDFKETQKDIVKNAFEKALSSLKKDFGEDITQWTWNKVHSLEHPHPIGEVAALRSFFNVGPFPINGGQEVINNMSFNYKGDGLYKITSGPSTRRVIDFSDIENSISILPTGQSGNPFSKYYKDQAEMYRNGEFRKMMMNKQEIMHTSSSLLIFKPNNK